MRVNAGAEKLTIFISGTRRDLPTERKRVARMIRRMGHEPVWAEKRGATDRPSRDECQRMARTCDVYLGLEELGTLERVRRAALETLGWVVL